ncbi:50S ribosomal protein L21e [Halomarina pelagica]|uniref:50S ribosomal protein L21e n=1 Tax=Halomarina pelagica TaxID=2961599 RepID=UPI0020C24608|nr:50S ribosomal protein L21e [Halomarina sp. BND7]
MPSSKGPLHGTREKLSNDPRERGTSPPQRAIQRYEVGEKVHLKIDPSVPEGRFHPRFNGLTGEVVGEQGRAFKVEITDGGKRKTLIARPAHLRRQRNE